MVGQNSSEFVFVLGLEERIKRAFGQLAESLVGGSKNGEWTFAFEGVD